MTVWPKADLEAVPVGCAQKAGTGARGARRPPPVAAGAQVGSRELEPRRTPSRCFRCQAI